jgi:hypothetical protein
MVLGRVVEQLGDVPMVTEREIEGLFAVDLAFLQDFYGVINFGSQEEYEDLLRTQQQTLLVRGEPADSSEAVPEEDAAEAVGAAATGTADGGIGLPRRPLRAAIEEFSPRVT